MIRLMLLLGLIFLGIMMPVIYDFIHNVMQPQWLTDEGLNSSYSLANTFNMFAIIIMLLLPKKNRDKS